MQRFILIIVLAAIGWIGYTRFQPPLRVAPAASEAPVSTPAARAFASETQSAAAFKCDGRTHCSQMTSCDEATYFLKNCPGTKMDGNNDGIPCEKQWCK